MQVLKTEDPVKDIYAEVNSLMIDGVREGVSPGMVLLISKEGEIVFLDSYGDRTHKEEQGKEESAVTSLSVDTVYDVAGITAAMITTTLIMKLYENGKIRLEDRASRYIQGFGVHGKSAITIANLLEHTSGLAGWHPFYEELIKANAGARLGVLTSRGAREYIQGAIIRSHLKYEPGTKRVYSDLGLIVLGNIIETLTGQSIDKVAYRNIFQPLGLRSTSYIDLSMIKRRAIQPITEIISPTEECPWRKRVLCGEVHDDNAWVMGGISSHAGIFSTARDLNLFSKEMLLSYSGKSEFLKRDTIMRFWDKSAAQRRMGGGWLLGWDSPSEDNGMLESCLSENSVGVSGFTGCSLWLEPEQGAAIILMSNRINPSRSNKKILGFRPKLYKAALLALSERI